MDNFLYAMLGVGVLCLLGSAYLFFTQWPSVKGIVTNSYYDGYYTTYPTSRPAPFDRVYVQTIGYEYTFQGTTHHNSIFAPLTYFARSPQVLRIDVTLINDPGIKKSLLESKNRLPKNETPTGGTYKKGTEITVNVNPQNPADSRIEMTSNSSLWATVLAFGGVILIGIAAALIFKIGQK